MAHAAVFPYRSSIFFVFNGLTAAMSERPRKLCHTS
jgi:hypothetical protein